MLSPSQVIGEGIRGEYSARYMFQFRDIWSVGRAASLDKTTIANYFLANHSAWVGLRSEIRNLVLETWLPEMARLADTIAPHAPGFTAMEVNRRALPRLCELGRLAREANVPIMLVVAPTPRESDADQGVLHAGIDANIPILLPLTPEQLMPSDYLDGFHLAASGAALFTDRLAILLRRGVLRPTQPGFAPLR
jgi:hypothetical protein